MPKYTADTIFTPEIYAKPELLGRNEIIWDMVLDYKLNFKKGLEMCSGWGVIGSSLLLKDTVQELHYTDLMKSEVTGCQENVDASGLTDRATVYQSDVWENIDTTFDLIIVNPPWFNCRVEYWVSMGLRDEAWLDDDWQFHKRFFKGLKQHLNPGGRCLLNESSLGSHISVFEPMIPDGLVAKECKVPVEVNPSWILEISYD